MPTVFSQLTAEEQKQVLIQTHLFFDPGTASLRERAFGEIILKVLFEDRTKAFKTGAVVAKASQLLGIPALPRDQIEEALDLLRSKGFIQRIETKKASLWKLIPKKADSIDSSIREYQQRVFNIVEKYFGSAGDPIIVGKWFMQAGADVFSTYGEIWARSFSKEISISPPNRTVLSRVLNKSIDAHNLQHDRDSLAEGFRAFLQDSTDQDAKSQVWNFTQAMFSAKLVAVSIGPDPLSYRELSGAVILLDTNLLFDASLEKSRYANAFKALASSLLRIDSRLAIIRRTKSEYEGVIGKKGQGLVKVFQEIPTKIIDVIKDSRDPIIQTALSRQVRTAADVETFINTIRNAPRQINGVNIEMLEDEEIEKACMTGERDSRKKLQIQAAWRLYHSWDKKDLALSHDSALDHAAAELKRRGQRVFILTKDRAMQIASQQWSGEGIPTWISLDTMVQLLAVYGAGPGFTPADFSPMIAKMIETELIVDEKLFGVDDLAELFEIEERANELTVGEIETFARKVQKFSFSGRPRYDREISHEVGRIIFKKDKQKDEQVAALKEAKNISEQQASIIRKEQAGAVERLSKLLIPGLKRKILIKNLVLIVLVLTTTSFFSWLGWKIYYEANQLLGGTVFAIALTDLFVGCTKVITKAKEELSRVKENSIKAATVVIEGHQ